MIGQAACEAILKKALHLSDAGATDVYLLAQQPALTRFADNVIHQNVAHNNAQLHVRAVIGKRQGRATTNNLSDDGIARAVQQAHDHARLMPEDPHFNGLPTPGMPGHPRAARAASRKRSSSAGLAPMPIILEGEGRVLGATGDGRDAG